MATPEEQKALLSYATPSREPGRRTLFWRRFFYTLFCILLLGAALAVALFVYVSMVNGGRD